jgi:membrane protease YdiL (CAAX protease family)
MNDTLQQIAEGIEGAIALSGLWLLWRLVLSPDAKQRARPPALTFWAISTEKFFMCVWVVLVGGFLAAAAGSYLTPSLGLPHDMAILVAGSAMHFGIIAGVIISSIWVLQAKPQPAPRVQVPAVLIGLTVFLIVMPVVSALSLFSDWLLTALKFPTEKQDLVEMLMGTDSVLVKATIIVLAVFIAPIGEELVFRAGLFRYLRGRAPRWVALTAPALLFAALHVTQGSLNGLVAVIPLVGLAIVFSLAYERSGRISTTIIAHALFNLNSAAFAIITASKG